MKTLVAYFSASGVTKRAAEALALANRLRIPGIDEIHASPMGRARETAEPLSRITGLPVIIEPWAHEIDERSNTYYPDGKRKNICGLPIPYLTAPEYRRMSDEEAAREIEGIRETRLMEQYRETADGLDGMLSRLGYIRNERGFYDAISPNARHIALFTHGGALRVMLSHLLHIPFHMIAATVLIQYTGVTVMHFNETPGETGASALCIGDIGHLYGGPGEPQRHYAKAVLY